MAYGLRGLADAPLGIVATMPPLPASACTAGQTYIPPGGKFTSGSMAGQITATGACQDGNAVGATPAPPTPGAGQPAGSLGCVSLPNLVLAFFPTVRMSDATPCVGPFSLMTWAIAAGTAWLLWPKGGR